MREKSTKKWLKMEREGTHRVKTEIVKDKDSHVCVLSTLAEASDHMSLNDTSPAKISLPCPPSSVMR